LTRNNARKDAETLALEGLAFVAASATDLAQFVESSGITPDELRARAQEPGLLAAVLAFLLSDDKRLLSFCSEHGVEPKQLHIAQYALGQGRRFSRS
jgi:hypothetical protein